MSKYLYMQLPSGEIVRTRRKYYETPRRGNVVNMTPNPEDPECSVVEMEWLTIEAADGRRLRGDQFNWVARPEYGDFGEGVSRR